MIFHNVRLGNASNYLFLTVVSLLLFLPGLSKLPVVDRDEAHFAQASRQMLQSRNYFRIRFQEKTRFQKPPGINWLQVGFVKLFSQSEAKTIWPYRMPSLLGALFSILFLYFFSCRLIDKKVARLAALLLSSTLLLAIEAHMAVIDASLLFSIVLMQGSLWVIYEAKKLHWGWALCFWLALSFGFVLKGVTPLVGFLSLGMLCLLERRVNWLRALHFVPGLILFILINLVWVLLVNEAEQANYLLKMFQHDLLPKLQGGHESHGKPPFFHLFLLPLTFWPASIFLWQAGVYAFQHRHEKTVKFLLSWIVPTWIFFEIMPTKLPQYVLPTFPAIAILCALALTNFKKSEFPSKFLRVLQFLWWIFSVGLAISILILTYQLRQQITLISILLFLGIILISFLIFHFVKQSDYQKACLMVILLALFSYSLSFEGFLPKLKPLWLTQNMVQLIDENKLSRAKPLLVVGFEEPSLVFNLNTYEVKFTDMSTLKQILNEEPSRLAVIESSAFQKKDFHILAEVQGFNYSKGRWLKLFLVSQYKNNLGEKYVAF